MGRGEPGGHEGLCGGAGGGRFGVPAPFPWRRRGEGGGGGRVGGRGGTDFVARIGRAVTGGDDRSWAGWTGGGGGGEDGDRRRAAPVGGLPRPAPPG